MIRKLLFLFLVGTIPFLTSCDKLKGDDGAIGPAGETGAKGDPGEAGDPASALQVSLDTLSTDANGNQGFSFKLSKEAINSFEKGVVLVYAKNNNVWFPLPGIVIFADGISNYSFAYAVDDVSLVVQLFQLDEVPKKRKFQTVRVVIVPAVNARLNAQVDYEKYEEVRKAFNLAP